ncbi:glutathione S-transferase A-like isoform X1 [Branchiostoma floridae x Branchiostoma japonicum]
MASDITLYWASGSVPSWRAMICLEEKGLSGYNSKFLSFQKGEHKSEEVLKINPRGQVPTFKHGDAVVNESLGVCLYLENTFKNQGIKLLPDDPVQQALVLQRTIEVDNIRDKAIGGIFHYSLRTKPEDRDEAYLKGAKKALAEELKTWEGYLAQHGDSYIAGKDFTLADTSLFPMLAFVVRNQLPLKERFPCLASYYERLKERPSVKTSWPPHWQTTPAPDLMKDA